MLPRHIEQAVVERPLAIALGLAVIEPRLVRARFLEELLAYLGNRAIIASEQVGHIVALAISTIAEPQADCLSHFVELHGFRHRFLPPLQRLFPCKYLIVRTEQLMDFAGQVHRTRLELVLGGILGMVTSLNTKVYSLFYSIYS